MLKMGTSSLSEALQKKLNKKDCPYLQDCNVKITKDFFNRTGNNSRWQSARRIMDGRQKATVQIAQVVDLENSQFKEPKCRT